jgi:two-component system, NarL family, sensor histidine kinase DevS
MDTSALTREQLEERLVALHRASLELVQNISPESLMERIATVACEQVSARYAAVGILGEDGTLEKFIPIGITPAEIRRMAHPPVGKGLIGALMHGEKPICIPEIGADPRSSGFPRHHPHMSSFLGVPIRRGDQQLGQIYLTNKLTGGDFTQDDQAVIEMLASYAAVALSNARLVEKLTRGEAALKRRNENLALLNDLAITLAASVDIDQILNKALAQVINYLNLDAGEIFLRQEGSKTLQLLIHQGEHLPRLWSQDQFLTGEGAVGQASAAGMPQLIDLSALRRSAPGNGYMLAHSLYESGPNQVACFPLNGRSGVFGVLCVASSHSQPLDDLEMQFLSSISFWIGAAIENTRLKVQQRRLAVLEERERIGMDLHDGIIQDIYAVGLTLEHARLLLDEDTGASRQRIEQAVSDLNSTIRDIRAYILDLRPRKLHEENLMDGLRRLVAEFRANTLVEVSLQGPPGDRLLLPEGPASALFHICQEALANVAKHAHSRHLSVAVWTTPNRALLEISDDGRGFDAGQAPQTIGHGLANMQTRAANAGGEVEITSEAGVGTTVLVWVPIPDDAAE